jgi:GDP-L-fucose synthase
MMQFNDLVYVAGHTGLIGSAFVRRLESQGFKNILTVSHAELELTDSLAVDTFFKTHRPEYVFLAAGRVGGIVENQTYPADFIRTNLSIQLNVLDAAHRHDVKKLVLFGSSCMYPRECPQPMPEDYLLSGQPEPTSIAYAIAKLAGVQMCLSYNKQFGNQRFIPIIPNSAYGPNDNFDPKAGHVLSVLIRRFHEAKLEHAPEITLWGTGNPRREFIHADDIADASIWLLTKVGEDLDLPINVGVEMDYSIKELAEHVANVVGYDGQINWDTSKPDGAPRKLLDSSRIKTTGWQAKTPFVQGLKDSYEWYLKHAK